MNQEGEQDATIDCGTLCVALGMSFAGAAQARTYITQDVTAITLTQSDCLDHADRAIRRNGFEVPGTTLMTRHGIRGEYTVAIRCAADKGLVFFVVAGPSVAVTEKYSDALQHDF